MSLWVAIRASQHITPERSHHPPDHHLKKLVNWDVIFLFAIYVAMGSYEQVSISLRSGVTTHLITTWKSWLIGMWIFWPKVLWLPFADSIRELCAGAACMCAILGYYMDQTLACWALLGNSLLQGQWDFPSSGSLATTCTLKYGSCLVAVLQGWCYVRTTSSMAKLSQSNWKVPMMTSKLSCGLNESHAHRRCSLLAWLLSCKRCDEKTYVDTSS